MIIFNVVRQGPEGYELGEASVCIQGFTKGSPPLLPYFFPRGSSILSVSVCVGFPLLPHSSMKTNSFFVPIVSRMYSLPCG